MIVRIQQNVFDHHTQDFPVVFGISLNARNAKTARNVFRGYAAVTRRLRGRLQRIFMAVGIVGTQKIVSDTKTN